MPRVTVFVSSDDEKEPFCDELTQSNADSQFRMKRDLSQELSDAFFNFYFCSTIFLKSIIPDILK